MKITHKALALLREIYDHEVGCIKLTDSNKMPAHELADNRLVVILPWEKDLEACIVTAGVRFLFPD